MAGDTAALIAARRRQAQECHQRALTAIRHLNRTRQPVTFSSVARQANVSRRYLYTTADLADRIRSARSNPQLTTTLSSPGRTTSPDAASTASTPAEVESATIAALRHQIRRMQAEHRQQIATLTARTNELARENAILLGRLLADPSAAQTNDPTSEQATR